MTRYPTKTSSELSAITEQNSDGVNRHSSDMVERVSMAISFTARIHGGIANPDEVAKAALEASHHDSIVAENQRLRTALQQIHDLAEGLLNNIEAEEALA